MRRPTRLLAPRSWLRLPARTARLRLTLLYGALFLATGTGLLALIYLGVNHTSVSTASRSSSGLGSSSSAHQSPPPRVPASTKPIRSFRRCPSALLICITC